MKENNKSKLLFPTATPPELRETEAVPKCEEFHQQNEKGRGRPREELTKVVLVKMLPTPSVQRQKRHPVTAANCFTSSWQDGEPEVPFVKNAAFASKASASGYEQCSECADGTSGLYEQSCRRCQRRRAAPEHTNF